MRNSSRSTELRGAKAIAYELGVSDRTVRRWHEKGLLPTAKKLGGRTSPIRLSKRDAARLRGYDE